MRWRWMETDVMDAVPTQASFVFFLLSFFLSHLALHGGVFDAGRVACEAVGASYSWCSSCDPEAAIDVDGFAYRGKSQFQPARRDPVYAE